MLPAWSIAKSGSENPVEVALCGPTLRHYMSEVAYNPRGNSVSMTKLFRNNGKK